MGMCVYVGGGVYAFTLTVGETGTYLGYGRGFTPSGSPVAVPPAFGLISNEPAPNETLFFFAQSKSAAYMDIRFEGDIRAKLNGKNIYINSVLYPVSSWDLVGGRTYAGFPSGPFVNGNTYEIAIKP